MAQVSPQKLQELADRVEDRAVKLNDRHGGRYIDHVFEAADEVAHSYTHEHGGDPRALQAALMRVHGYEAQTPAGNKFGQDYDLPGFHGRGDQEFFF